MAAQDVSVSVNPNEPSRSAEQARAEEEAPPPAAEHGGTMPDAAASNAHPSDFGLQETAAHDTWLGRVLDGRYRVTNCLGEGGMGAVFVAEHLKLRKTVAVKVIREQLAGNGEVAARFAREAMATAQFEHPHVASAIDYGTLAEGGAYFVMQLVRGESLRQMLDSRGALPWPVACEVLAQVADALSAARNAGIVHRDLKPENIVVETRDDGSYLAKVLDFGIAHVGQPPSTPDGLAQRTLTRVGTVMGTPGYMSPEQAVGDRVDHRTDLYALGVVLWECLTGKALWDGPDVTAIITKQLRDTVPRPREVIGDPLFPRPLDDLVLQLCARSADERPEHAGAVRDALRALAHRPVGPATAIAEHASSQLAAARQRFDELPAPSRKLALTSVAVLALVVAVAALDPEPSEGDQAGKPSTTATADREGADAPEAAEEASDAQPQAPEQPSTSLAGRALKIAERIVAEAPKLAQGSDGRIPKELESDAEDVLQASRLVVRRRAAAKILRYKGEGADQLPAYLLAVARLERARTCKDRRSAITEIEQTQDERALPSLNRIADAARSGCGFLGLSDCYGCVRGDVRDAIASLSGKQ